MRCVLLWFESELCKLMFALSCFNLLPKTMSQYSESISNMDRDGSPVIFSEDEGSPTGSEGSVLSFSREDDCFSYDSDSDEKSQRGQEPGACKNKTTLLAYVLLFLVTVIGFYTVLGIVIHYVLGFNCSKVSFFMLCYGCRKTWSRWHRLNGRPVLDQARRFDLQCK